MSDEQFSKLDKKFDQLSALLSQLYERTDQRFDTIGAQLAGHDTQLKQLNQHDEQREAKVIEQQIRTDLFEERASKIDHMASTIDGLDQHLADYFGKLTHHLDTQHNELTNSIDVRLDRVATMIDKLIARVETDGEERTAIDNQVQWQGGWIQQVAKEGGVKLSYER